MRVQVFGEWVYLSGLRSIRKGELMIVASNRPSNEVIAIAIYLRCWEIESVFQGLKTRGFRFEDTHMTAPERIAKLMGLLAVAFDWAHKVGEWKALQQPIKLNQFHSTQRPQYTFFGYGLDHNHIREALLWPDNKYQQLRICICLLFSLIPLFRPHPSILCIT